MDTSTLVSGAFTASLYAEYEVSGVEYATLDAEYEIQANDIEFAVLDAVYSVAQTEPTMWEPTITPVSDWTQAIGNKYPTWHAARRRRGSNIQRLINSFSGYHLEQIANLMARVRMDNFLPTADTSSMSHVFSAPAPSVNSASVRKNILVNSDFATPGLTRLRTPYAWTDCQTSTGEITRTKALPLIGHASVKLKAEPEELVTFFQSLPLQSLPDTSFVCSAWYSGLSATQDFGIDDLYCFAAVTYSDGTVETFRKRLDSLGDGEWKVIRIPVTLAREAYRFKVGIVADNRFGTEDLALVVSAFQLEPGTSGSSWCPAPSDPASLQVVDDKTTAEEEGVTLSVYPKEKLFRIEGQAELAENALPLSMEVSAATDESAVSKNRLGVSIDKDGSRFSIGWRIEAGQVRAYNADLGLTENFGIYSVADVHYPFKIDEPWYYSIEDLGVTQVCEALTVFNDLIWIVALETYRGQTYRVLKICSPGTRWDDTNHLECLREINVGISTGDCTFVGQIDGRSDQLLLTIDDEDYVADLLFNDFFTTAEGVVITRTKHPGRVIAV